MTRYALALMAGFAMLGSVPALSADLLINNQPSMAGYVPAGGNWDGAFIGAFGGFAWDTFDATDLDPIDGSGWLLGVTAGANFTVTPGLVAGIAGDIAWNDVHGEFTDGGGTVVSSLDWTGSLRGRLGWDADAIMPYVTGGLAFGGGTLAGDGPDASATHIGWTAGAGVEMAVADQLSVDLQYRYSDYGTEEYVVSGTPNDYKLTTNQLTAGLNYKF